jgi:hypothetical protein
MNEKLREKVNSFQVLPINIFASSQVYHYFLYGANENFNLL